jgi:hypothetical protein
MRLPRVEIAVLSSLAACVSDGGLFSEVDPSERLSCPSGWSGGAEGAPNAAHCYRVFADKTDFDAAAADCAAQASGGHLATIDNQAEIDTVVPLMAMLTDGPWIGAQDPDGDCEFSWITGEPWSWPVSGEPGVEPWAGAEPSACGVDTCVHLYSVGVFNDIGCAMQLPRLCELELE